MRSQDYLFKRAQGLKAAPSSRSRRRSNTDINSGFKKREMHIIKTENKCSTTSAKLKQTIGNESVKDRKQSPI